MGYAASPVATGLRARYAMSGTEIGYAATRSARSSGISSTRSWSRAPASRNRTRGEKKKLFSAFCTRTARSCL
eukprot:2726840-Rhodomonas_salina.1